MKLGFYYHIPAEHNEKNEICMPGYLGVFIDGLAMECDEVICFLHSPLAKEKALMNYIIKSSNVRLVDIGPHDGMFKRTWKAKKYLHKISPILSEIDLLLIRGPSPLMPFIAALCRRKATPYAYLLVGDYLKSLSGVKAMNPLKRGILWSFYRCNKFLQDRHVKQALLFTNNVTIFEGYNSNHQNLHEIRTTTLNKDNFFYREDTCLGESIKLAYAGRIEPTKGLDDIIDALVKIQACGVDAELHVAGWDPSSQQEHLAFIKKKAASCGLNEKFVFHGMKQVGEELFSFYRSCDIFILATKGNEGFPRTIWEAMAQSMPIISTRVGSIPDMLQDGKDVLLIDQANPEQLAAAITRLKEDKAIRKFLIKNGYDLARSNTIEIQSAKMVGIIGTYLQNEKH